MIAIELITDRDGWITMSDRCEESCILIHYQPHERLKLERALKQIFPGTTVFVDVDESRSRSEP